MHETPITRGAIVFSSWGWETYAVPERISIALGRAGWRVLHCDLPRSFVRKVGGKRRPLAFNVDGFTPQILSYRLNRLRSGRRWQARLMVPQVLEQARQMGIEQLVAIYPCLYWPPDMVPGLKARGASTVFLCMDHLAPEWHDEFAGRADLTLAIPRTMCYMLRAKYDEKVVSIPQFGPDFSLATGDEANSSFSVRVQEIPRPRLAYLGNAATGRLHVGLVRELFSTHPEWHLITCGAFPSLKLPNLHDIGWIRPEQVAQLNRMADVGFMPYDCSREVNLHCLPLKLFDYFADGLPVVSTPLIALWEYGNLVYLGDTAAELAAGIQQALAESRDDPRREERRRIARAHSMDEMSRLLSAILIERASSGLLSEAARS